MNQQQNTPYQGTARAAGDSKPLKPRHEPPKGHEAFLEALRASSAHVEIWPAGVHEGSLKGTIKSADKFTISLAVKDGIHAGRTLVLFKHAISGFSAAEKAA